MSPFILPFPFERLQRKSLPPLSNQTTSPQREDFLFPHPAAAEKPTHEPSSPSTNQITPEPPLTVQTSATTLPVQELSEAPVTLAAHSAQEQTAVPPVQVSPPVPHGDTKQTDTQEVPVTLVSAVTTVAPSFPLSPVATSVPPVLSPLTPTVQPEVEQLCPSALLFLSLFIFELNKRYFLTSRLKTPTATICKS